MFMISVMTKESLCEVLSINLKDKVGLQKDWSDFQRLHRKISCSLLARWYDCHIDIIDQRKLRVC